MKSLNLGCILLLNTTPPYPPLTPRVGRGIPPEGFWKTLKRGLNAPNHAQKFFGKKSGWIRWKNFGKIFQGMG
jgi:hypothetical protein